MITLYLVCLMFGGTLLALSLLLGGDHDSDSSDVHIADGDTDVAIGDGDVHGEIGGGDIDADLDADPDMAVSIDGDTDVSIDTSADSVHAVTESHSEIHAVQGQGAAEAFKFISLRSLIFFTAFFGLTGSVLTWLGTAATATLLSSIGMGGFASVLTHKLMNYLKRTESGESVNLSDLTGHTAKVVLSPSKTRKGKINVEVQGQTLTLLALIDESAAVDTMPAQAWALIVRVEPDAVYIVEADYMK